MHFRTVVLSTLFAAGQLFFYVQAHVEMKFPTPFRSKFLVPQPADADFSMTNPLNQDGSNFPCKGYQSDDLASTATLTAGGTFPLVLEGSATHNGGSCQLSMSYDGGKTWVVFYSIVGGCPIDTENYTIPVPSDLPASKRALLAWSWENNTGNREFYMNCAPVTVVSQSNTFTGPRMHEANVFGPTDCITPGNFDMVYPNPGPFVHFGGKYVGGNTGPATILTPCSFDENVNVTVGGDGSTSSTDGTTSISATSATDPVPSSEPTDSAATVATDPTPVADPISGTSTSTIVITSTGIDIVTVRPTITVAGSSSTDPTPTPADPPAPTPAVVGNATSSDVQAGAACSPDGSITCGPTGLTWFMCDHGALVDMGSVASGTTCSNGQITRKRGLPPYMWRRSHAFGKPLLRH